MKYKKTRNYIDSRFVSVIGRGGMGCYTYENGRFTVGCPIACLFQMGLDDDADIEWFDVDAAFEASGASSWKGE